MIINKFQGKTKDEAIEIAKREMGENVVIMNVKEVSPKGIAGFLRLRPGLFEVTAAVEDKDMSQAQAMPDGPAPAASAPATASAPAPAAPAQKPAPVSPARSGFDAVVDEKIEFSRGPALVPSAPGDDWKGALDEVSKIVEKSETIKKDTKPNIKPVLKDEGLIKAKAAAVATERYAAANPAPAPSDDDPDDRDDAPKGKMAGYIRMAYNTLLENEVNEQHINMILDEVKKTINDNSSVDHLLSNIYQKMVLLLGKPAVIECGKKHPRVVFFIGPTGVGKTTTLSKIAAEYMLEEGRKVALLTADTYRISAIQQLQTYANIMNVPIDVVYSSSEINEAVEKHAECDLIFVDTAGFSHKNEEQKEDLKKLVNALDEKYEKDVYLVLSATTKYTDLLDIADSYRDISDYRLIFTKLDETDRYGNILNLRIYTGSSISYAAIGQSVPEDIEVLDAQKIVKKLLGGR